MALSEGTRAIIKEVAREVMGEYKKVISDEVDRKIHLHKVECEVGKYRKITAIISATIGGIIVAGVNWVLKK